MTPTVQDVATVGSPTSVRVAPFISQTAFSPVVEFRQKKSERPSALKSPVPTTVHVAATEGIAISCVPADFISHNTFVYVTGSRQSRSERPSPSKSPEAASCQFVG